MVSPKNIRTSAGGKSLRANGRLIPTLQLRSQEVNEGEKRNGSCNQRLPTGVKEDINSKLITPILPATDQEIKSGGIMQQSYQNDLGVSSSGTLLMPAETQYPTIADDQILNAPEGYVIPGFTQQAVLSDGTILYISTPVTSPAGMGNVK